MSRLADDEGFTPGVQRIAERSVEKVKTLINGLKAKNDEGRDEICAKIRRIVGEWKKGSPDDYHRMLQEVNQVIFKLVQEEPFELTAGIAAINTLLDVVDPTAAQLAQLGNYTRLALRNSDKTTVVAATKTLGRLSKKGGVLTAEHIEREAKRAIETLSDRETAKDSTNVYASVLVLKELAVNVPALFVQYVEKCIRPIWVSIRDHNQVVREAGADTLKVMIDISSTHADSRSNSSTQWYPFMWEQCKAMLTSRDAALNHGALLCVGDVFQNTGPFLYNKYTETYRWVLALKDSSHSIVRLSVLRAIPVLARYARAEFRTLFLSDTLAHLYSVMKRDNKDERVAALCAVSDLSISMGPAAWRSHWGDSLKAVQSVIERKNRTTPEALVTYARVAAVCPPQVEPRIMDFITVLFQYHGVSKALAETLEIISQHFPSLKRSLQNKLLDALLKTLTGQSVLPVTSAPVSASSGSSLFPSSPGPTSSLFSPKSPLGGSTSIPIRSHSRTASGSMPHDAHATSTSSAFSFFGSLRENLGGGGGGGGGHLSDENDGPMGQSYQSVASAGGGSGSGGTSPAAERLAASVAIAVGDPPRPVDVQLALCILRTYDFSSYDLAAYVRDYLIKFLDSENAATRKEAALTCAAIVVPKAAPPTSSLCHQKDQKRVYGGERTSSSQNVHNVSANSSGPFSSSTASLHADCPDRAAMRSYVEAVSKSNWGKDAATTKGPKGAVVSEVVARLLTIAVSDPDCGIRFAIHQSLDGRFARHLVTSDNLRFLVMSLHDEVTEIRLLATETISRLVEYNPSQVLPCVRRQLLQTMSLIEHSIDSHTLHESLRTLSRLTEAAPQVVQLYTSVIMDVLLPRMDDLMADADVAVSFLSLLASFAAAVRTTIVPYLDTLLPFVISVLKDRSSLAKLDASLRAIGALVQFTAYAIRPLEQYPDLLPALFSILRADVAAGGTCAETTHPTSKREAVKVLGICGALDPFRWQLRVQQGNRASQGVWDRSNIIVNNAQQQNRASRNGKGSDHDRRNQRNGRGGGGGGGGGGHAPQHQQRGARSSGGGGDGEEGDEDDEDWNPTEDDLDCSRGGGGGGGHAQHQHSRASRSPPGSSQRGGGGGGGGSSGSSAGGGGGDPLESSQLGACGNCGHQGTGAPQQGAQGGVGRGGGAGAAGKAYRRRGGGEGGARGGGGGGGAGVGKQRDDAGCPTPVVNPNDIVLHEVLDFKNNTYFTIVVLKGLIPIMADTSLKRYHKSVVQVVTNIIRSTKGHNIHQLVPLFLPPFINMLKMRGKQEADPATTRYLLGQLCVLVPLMGGSVKEYLAAFHGVIVAFFHKTATLGVVLRLIADLATACAAEFKAFLPQLIPRVTTILLSESLPDDTIGLRCLNILHSLGAHLNDFLHQVIPTLMALVSAEASELPPGHLTLRHSALKILRKLGKHLYLEDHASAIIHPLLKVFVRPENVALRDDIMGLFCLLVLQLGSDFAVFIPIVHKALTSVHGTHQKYTSLEERLLKNLRLPPFHNFDLEPSEERLLTELLNVPLEEAGADGAEDAGLSGIIDKGGPDKIQVNEKAVIKALQAGIDGNVVTRDGWARWLRNFTIELLQQSPLLCLKMIANLASQHQPLARDLFNTAFVCVWDQLSDRAEEQVRKLFEKILKNASLPTDVLGPLLALLEYMDANDVTMQIDPQFLSDKAARTSALAKALRWQEIAFQISPQIATEGLVTIYNQLGHTQSGLGLLRVAERSADAAKQEVSASSYERLGKWELALEQLQRDREILLREGAEDRLLQTQPQRDSASSGGGGGGGGGRGRSSGLHVRTNSVISTGDGNFYYQRLMEVEVRMMRSLSNLGEWQQLYRMCKTTWETVTHDRRTEHDHDEEEEEGDSLHHAVAPYATQAAWRMGDWSFMGETVEKLPHGSYERHFHKAILALKGRDDATSQWAIDCARDCLAQELSALVPEGYERCYSSLVQCQQLAELEEIKLARSGDRNLKHLMLGSWMTRLRGCATAVKCWKDILEVRTLMVNPVDDCATWLKFVSLCRNQGQHDLEKKTLLLLVGHEYDQSFDPEVLVKDAGRYNPWVTFAYLKHLWAVGERKGAVQNLNVLVAHLKGKRCTEDHELLARCCLKLGDWTPEVDQVGLDRALEFHKQAVQYDRNWYRAWHAWALANQNLANSVKGDGLGQQMTHITSAVRGYVKSIILGPSHASILQDILRLLTLWFLHGQHPNVEAAVKAGIEVIQLDLWLLVIPQIIARVNASESRVASLVGHLLGRIGREFPQALVYALTVSAKASSGKTVQRRAGERPATTNLSSKVLDSMRETSAALVEQCEFVSNELIRVAIIWHELWNEGIEEASKLYFASKDVEGMLHALFPLHQMMEKQETLREVSFVQAYGRDMQEAFEWCQSYLRSGDEQHIHQAWELYYTTYRKLKKGLEKDFTILELQYCSPLLYRARDLDIIVPGLPHSRTAVRIASFSPRMEVMLSKQRPRKIAINGYDGVEYRFLLKGHEDLRLDERVMQLFGLVNALVQSDPATAMQTALQIQRFPVIPLNSNVGLIGWVDTCDTLHSLVKEFRERKKMRINVEYQHMVQMCYKQTDTMVYQYDVLPLINKVELFEYAMECTTGHDLYKVLWFQSGTAELWLERRTTYTLSLATMSMVGYILGLGDRHPNNLMLQRVTGKVVHIDFGDCFEVAMMRDKFPERIPFRLTRMLRNAMEVIGIAGNFRHTCENVMRVLREHKGSVMAMLEAFVHDPLLQWRLLGANDNTPADPAATQTEADQQKAAEKNAAMRHNIIAEYLEECTREAARATETRGEDMPPRKDRAVDERELYAASLRGDTVEAGSVRSPASQQQCLDAHKGVQLLQRIDDKLNGKDFDVPPAPESRPLDGSCGELKTSDSHATMPASAGGEGVGGGGGAKEKAALSPSLSCSGLIHTKQGDEGLSVKLQVAKLIDQATRVENLCSSYIGWCPFW